MRYHGNVFRGVPPTQPDADRMMTSACPVLEGIELTFADGRNGVIPFADIPEVPGIDDLADVELPNPCMLVLHTKIGEMIEFPWDFTRHYCDGSYAPRVEEIAKAGRQTIGARLRQLRESADLTQEALAANASIGRVTLVRIENGDQSPRYETLIAMAHALDRPLQDLLVPSEPALSRHD